MVALGGKSTLLPLFIYLCIYRRSEALLEQRKVLAVTADCAFSQTRACGRPAPSMEAVQIQGLLPVILNKLEGIVDIVRCSSVSKTWQAVSSQVCPTALFVPIHTVPTLDEDEEYIEAVELDRARAADVLIWLQSKHQQGHFCNLESLSIEQEQFAECRAEGSDTDDHELSLFCQSVLVLAGLWPL